MISLWLGAYDQGLAYAGLALGTYLTLRVLNFPDLTVDGSFALGGGAAAVLITEGVPVPAALALAVLFGCLAGMVTGLIHTRLGVNDLFAGILTTTGLYSITLRLMGRSNIPLTDTPAGILQLPDLGLGLDGRWAVGLAVPWVGELVVQWEERRAVYLAGWLAVGKAGPRAVRWACVRVSRTCSQPPLAAFHASMESGKSTRMLKYATVKPRESLKPGKT
jgi:ribose/xylose/arabinose/galactoside ABC-type transport system permease subunit